MNSVPHDPALPALAELFPSAGVPLFVAQMAQEVGGSFVEPETAVVSYVRYRPTRDCDILWSFPRRPGHPLLVSGKLSREGLGSRTARPLFRQSAEMVRAAMGGQACPYTYLPDRRLLLQVFPLDIRLPGLALAASTTWVRDSFCRSLGLARDELNIADSVPVQYKPWRRCVMRYVAEVQGCQVRYFGKLFRDERGAPMVERLLALRAQLVASGAPWDIAVPVMYVPEACMLVLAAVEESEELSPLLRKSVRDGDVRRTLREQIAKAAEGLFIFQRMVVEGLPCLGPREVLRGFEKELDGVVHVAPALGRSMRALLRTLELTASRLPPERMVLSHGAFRHNQFLRRGDTLIALDLDALCLSGMSADIGEFLAYLDLTALRRPQLRPVTPDCEEVFLSAVLKHPHMDLRWVAWYRTASQIKWSQRALLSLDPRWPELTESLMRVAQQTLAELAA
jgi:hypothetical protein